MCVWRIQDWKRRHAFRFRFRNKMEKIKKGFHFLIINLHFPIMYGKYFFFCQAY